MASAASESSEQLILSALDLFGRFGFEGTSTRAIAAAAGKPMSAITYHFGGKNELYRAVARHIATAMAAAAAPSVAAVQAMEEDRGAAGARTQIRMILSAIIATMVRPESASWARFIVREQMEPTPAFDELYNGPMGRTLANLARLIRTVAGDRIDEEEARLRALAMFGQALVFRVARAAVLRSTGWDRMGEDEVEAIRAVVLANVDAILDTLEVKDKS